MNASSIQSHPRRGFTLVELLVVMMVIGILVGMLMAGVLPALKRVREGAIQVEMKQIEIAMEQFKNKYGFYPPSFESGIDANGNSVGVSSAAQLMRYVNKIAPNNNERLSSGHGTGSASDGKETLLEHWWDEQGKYLDQESAVVFWLSGLCKNKQYPITGGQTGLIASHSFGTDTIERDVLFDFKTAQLYGNDGDEQVYKGDSSGTPIPGTLKGFILEYHQGHGVQGGDLAFKYRDAATYDLSDNGSSANSIGYCTGPAVGTSPNVKIPFLNPKSFQLITFGMDGEAGDLRNVYATTTDTKSEDNICNFADGRLQSYIIANSN